MAKIKFQLQVLKRFKGSCYKVCNSFRCFLDPEEEWGRRCRWCSSPDCSTFALAPGLSALFRQTRSCSSLPSSPLPLSLCHHFEVCSSCSFPPPHHYSGWASCGPWCWPCRFSLSGLSLLCKRPVSFSAFSPVASSIGSVWHHKPGTGGAARNNGTNSCGRNQSVRKNQPLTGVKTIKLLHLNKEKSSAVHLCCCPAVCEVQFTSSRLTRPSPDVCQEQWWPPLVVRSPETVTEGYVLARGEGKGSCWSCPAFPCPGSMLLIPDRKKRMMKKEPNNWTFMVAEWRMSSTQTVKVELLVSKRKNVCLYSNMKTFSPCDSSSLLLQLWEQR